MSKHFGKTWWGEQWLNSLTNIDYSNRLPRGSRYARNGSVKSIKIKNNQINAKVAGSRKTPYKVDIILPPFFNPELERFLKKLSSKPTIISKLLNGELDPAALEIANQEGLKVFPQQWTDFKMQCSCPDWAVPCKHLAAVIYKVSMEIDNNPFLAFELHNVDLKEELKGLGVFVNKENQTIPKFKNLLTTKSRVNKTFDEELAYTKLVYATIQDVFLPLVSLLSENPVFYDKVTDFKAKYIASLSKVVKNAKRLIAGKINIDDLLNIQKENKQIVSIHSNIKVIVDENFSSKILIDDIETDTKNLFVALYKIPSNHTGNYQASTAALHSAIHLAIHLIANGAITPQIINTAKKGFIIRWLPAILSKEVKLLVSKLASMLPPGILELNNGKKHKIIVDDIAITLLSILLTSFIKSSNILTKNDAFLELFFDYQEKQFNSPGEESLPSGIKNWLQKYYISQGDFKPHISVSELKNQKFGIEISVQDTNKENENIVALNEVLNNENYNHIRYEILQSISLFSNFIKGLDQYINNNAQESLTLDNENFTEFLIQIVPAIQLLDIEVLMPRALQKLLKPKTTVKLKSQNQNKSFIRLDQMLSFDWQIALGDTVMSWKEFQKLRKKSENLIKYKSNYIYIDDSDALKLAKHFEKEPTLNAFEILRIALGKEYKGAKVEMTNEVIAIIEKLRNIENIDLPKALNANLRPYQHRGYSWMYRNAQLGFGSVIADDMGLGKTIQVISIIQKFKEEKRIEKSKVLVVAPTGLMHNWDAEIQKFAPNLKAHIYHGSKRNIDEIEDYDIIISSYGVMRSDAKLINKKSWSLLVIDEAQNIKNNNTSQSKVIKSIKADIFIAMSGTPVENRLSELWSIMDYSNRGFLGGIKEFNDTYGAPIEKYNDKEVALKLQKVTSPFLMRRLKTDKSIISDLPDKIEIDTYATLTKDQVSLYEETLKKAMEDIERIEELDNKALFVRQGLVLQMIMALKQICNHPTQYLKNNVYDAELSGKMMVLFNTLDSIIDNNEKVLIFTQFKEMGTLLDRFISERYHINPQFYHGGTSVKNRKLMVDNFQNNRAHNIFILSLKAAGTGLNLTAAQHVIHYDLWWNPAVEAQATDRAYRIGQKNNVMVHRFITKNTFEEQINDMIQSKKALAEMAVAKGENWVGNLSNNELKEMFTLR